MYIYIVIRCFLYFCFVVCFFVACSCNGSKETQQTIPKEKHIGTPRECSEKIRSKDSIGFYSCCENLNACWHPLNWYIYPYGDSVIYHTYGDSITYHIYGDSIIHKDSLIRQKFYLIDTVKIVSPAELRENVKRSMRIIEDKANGLKKMLEDKTNESKR